VVNGQRQHFSRIIMYSIIIWEPFATIYDVTYDYTSKKYIYISITYVVYIYKYGEYFDSFVFVYDALTRHGACLFPRSGRDVFGHLCILCISFQTISDLIRKELPPVRYLDVVVR